MPQNAVTCAGLRKLYVSVHAVLDSGLFNFMQNLNILVP
jgi:hypothetical protein